MHQPVRHFKWFFIIPLLVFGCSSKQGEIANELGLPSWRTDVFLDESHAHLSIPPGLQGNFERRYQDPSGEIRGITIVRDGKRTWLAVGLPPQLVWKQVLKFLDKQGFKIEHKDPLEFYLRTAWKTRNIAQEGPFRLIFRINYSIRLERDVDSFTNVFVTAREIAVNASNITVIPDSSDAENKFLADLTNEIKQENRIFSEDISLENVGYSLLLKSVGNAHILLIDQNINLVWNRLGGTLERAGFTQEKKRRANNTIIVIPKHVREGSKQPLHSRKALEPWLVKVQPGKSKTIISITPTDSKHGQSTINYLQELYLNEIRNAY